MSADTVTALWVSAVAVAAIAAATIGIVLIATRDTKAARDERALRDRIDHERGRRFWGQGGER